MREFFKCWRPKVGVVALVVACVFCLIWARSQHLGDAIAFPFNGRQNLILSGQGTVIWCADTSTAWNRQVVMEFGGHPGYSSFIDETAVFDYKTWTITFWHFAVPLTLLSTYLLLWKPRKRTGPEHV